MALVDRTGREIVPSWAFDVSTVYVYPDKRDLRLPDEPKCSRRDECELIDEHGSGCATKVHISRQSLFSEDRPVD